MLYWVARPWRQAFNFADRATRREYWLFLFQLYAAFLILMFLAGMVLALVYPPAIDDEGSPVIGGLTIIAAILFLVPYLSASVRRLHDHDKSGWMFLLTFIPLAGWIFYLIMMLTPGTQGPNGYGSDPRDRLESAEGMSEIFS
jgi:uncharacterized membrane protein YhaH (DUF805 family)